MSHFTVLVTNTDKDDLENQLAPFDENRRMPMHISKTKEQLITEGRETFERAKKRYDEWQKDKTAYEADCHNPRHIEWLKNEVPAMIEALKNNDQEAMYKEGTSWYEPEDLDEDGNYISQLNDEAKWDWYQIGGRWAGFFVAVDGHEVDEIKVKDIDWKGMDQKEKDRRASYYDEQMEKPEDQRFIWSDNREADLKATKKEYINRPISHSTFAVLHKGKWYERGDMGWWGMVSDEKDKDVWDKEFKKLINSLDPETEVTVVDCHI